jgi:protein required for attachment to host cells
MNITIRLTKVEYEMLKELQKKDKKYKKGLKEKVLNEIAQDFSTINK